MNNNKGWKQINGWKYPYKTPWFSKLKETMKAWLFTAGVFSIIALIGYIGEMYRPV